MNGFAVVRFVEPAFTTWVSSANLGINQADFEATRVRVKKEKAESNLHTLRAVKRFRDDMGIDEDNEIETIAECSANKKQRPAAEQEVIDLSD